MAKICFLCPKNDHYGNFRYTCMDCNKCVCVRHSVPCDNCNYKVCEECYKKSSNCSVCKSGLETIKINVVPPKVNTFNDFFKGILQQIANHYGIPKEELKVDIVKGNNFVDPVKVAPVKIARAKKTCKKCGSVYLMVDPIENKYHLCENCLSVNVY